MEWFIAACGTLCGVLISWLLLHPWRSKKTDIAGTLHVVYSDRGGQPDLLLELESTPEEFSTGDRVTFSIRVSRK